MKDWNESKVHQWLAYIMIGSFCWITYFNFQGFFSKVVDLFATLPFWWFLIVLPIFAVSIVWSINLSEEEIQSLEEENQKTQQLMLKRERCIRLLHYEIDQIPPLQFVYYCSDLLRLLDYKEVRVIKNRRISALSSDGRRVYIECQCKDVTQMIEQKMLERFKLAMTDDHVQDGIFITTSSFSPLAVEWAEATNITCIDKQTLSQLILSATNSS